MADTKVRDRYSKKTLNAALEKLKVYGVTSIVRPTGFGKSYMLAKITSQKYRNRFIYQRSLYIYPLDIIKKDVLMKYGEKASGDVKFNNTDFVSYQALNNIREKGYKLKDGSVLTLEEFIEQYDLVMCDECHLCGSDGFRACWDRIKGLFGVDKAHLIGVTASPRRMDSFDVIEEIFGGEEKSVFSLSAGEAYRLGILKAPIRVVAVYNDLDFKKSVMDKVKESDASIKEEKDVLLKLDKIVGAEKVIEYVIEKVRPNIKYMKFIVFYVNKADLFEKCNTVSEWFKNIYSSYGFKVNDHIVVSSADSEICTEDDVKLLAGFKELAELKETDFKIDLIHCIDMLNMGYHVDDITGIVMMRGTRSEIIETQQIGRCLSVNAEHSPIIFDFVNNYNTKKWFKDEADREREADNVDINSMRGSGDSELKSSKDRDGVEVYMSTYTIEALKEVDKVINKKRLRSEYNAESILYWYKTLKAPIYVIAAMHGRTYDEMLLVLKGLGVNLQYEDEVDLKVRILEKLDKSYGRPEAEQFSILNSIFENEKVPDNEMKLYLSKKASE